MYWKHEYDQTWLIFNLNKNHPPTCQPTTLFKMAEATYWIWAYVIFTTGFKGHPYTHERSLNPDTPTLM